MVQKGPNGPETLLTCIIHNYRSYWPALGPFRYPRGAKRAISAQSLKLLGPNFGSQKKSSEYRHVAVLGSFGRFELFWPFWAILGHFGTVLGPFWAF